MNLLFLLSPIGMIVIGLSSIIYWIKKSKIALRFFLWGALTWIIVVILKGALAALFIYFQLY